MTLCHTIHINHHRVASSFLSSRDFIIASDSHVVVADGVIKTALKQLWRLTWNQSEERCLPKFLTFLCSYFLKLEVCYLDLLFSFEIAFKNFPFTLLQ